MSESDQPIPPATAHEASVAADTTNPQPPDAAVTAEQQKNERRQTRRWWIKLFVQPLLFLACGAILFAGLGLAQRLGWISGGSGGGGHDHASVSGGDVMYICPMMCTPPQSEPGRCPVCGMELVPASSAGSHGDSRSVQIDPAARRVANIHTVAVKSMPITRTIRAIGELRYDEGTLKTISAYVDGRLERLYADYTGVVVKKGDHLALVYSPRLYSAQVELLLARKSREESRSATLQRIIPSNRDLYESARQRLIELGMTAEQVDQMEQAGEANSRMHLCAPISGTVIEKLAVEGQYVTEGDAIFKLADLSTVWLMLKLFPEDAATIRYGQQVEAEVQSLPGRTFAGRVAFIDPNVDPKTRTVGVRVVIPNDDGVLRVGDYAKATLDVPQSDSPQMLVYDPELANNARDEALVVPRDAVLMAGSNSVVYVETEPGRFELRRVVLGPLSGDLIVVRSGVKEGEQVATRGNFLIDSQMQLAGNPSLIDPTKAQPRMDDAMSAEMIATLSGLSQEDRALAEKQGICPVTEYALGSMGMPPKVDVNGMPVFICCEVCREKLLAEPDKYLAKLEAHSNAKNLPEHMPQGSRPQRDLPPIGTPQIIAPEDTPPAATREASRAGNTADSPLNQAAAPRREAVR
ncbi:MAG: efflux RND transporter periplasmic adaptor subunit [Planctomycetaceae bacterium]